MPPVGLRPAVASVAVKFIATTMRISLMPCVRWCSTRFLNSVQQGPIS